MANTLTDTYSMVKKETFAGGGFFGRGNQSIRTGFCLVVFRNGRYLFSIEPDDQDGGRRLRNGDEIMEVNLGPQELNMSGTIKTRDGYEMGFHVVVGVRVFDAPLFAERYRQGVDPFQQVQTAIITNLATAGPLNRHEDIKEVTMRRITVDQVKQRIKHEFGLVLGENGALQFNIDPDPRWVELAKQRHIHEMERIDGDQRRDEHAKDKDFDRVQLVKDALTADQIATMHGFSAVDRQILLDRFAEYRRDRYSIREIIEMEPDLVPILLDDPKYRAQIEPLLLNPPKPMVDSDGTPVEE